LFYTKLDRCSKIFRRPNGPNYFRFRFTSGSRNRSSVLCEGFRLSENKSRRKRIR